jgi:hypothetical protein
MANEYCPFSSIVARHFGTRYRRRMPPILRFLPSARGQRNFSSVLHEANPHMLAKNRLTPNLLFCAERVTRAILPAKRAIELTSVSRCPVAG